MSLNIKEKEVARVIEAARTAEEIGKATTYVVKSKVKFPIRAAAYTILNNKLMELRMQDIEDRMDKLEGEKE